VSAAGAAHGGMAFLGCGRAARAHASVLRGLNRRIPLHFASRDRARAEALGSRFGGAGTYASYEDALNAPAVRVAVVTTPPDRHLELTLAALEAGKDVVVEKPAFRTAEAFGRVREAAAAADRSVLVAENYFYKPVRRRLARLIGEGVVGDPLFVRLSGVKRQIARGWRADREVAGGALLEGGIHWVNFMTNLGLGEARVRGFRADPPAPADQPATEESLVLVFAFDSGCVGTLSFSWEVPSPLQGIRFSVVHGREGSIWFESNGIFLLARGRRTALSLLPGVRDLGGFRAMWTDFLTALSERREPEMTFDLAERDVRQVLTAYAGPDG